MTWTGIVDGGGAESEGRDDPLQAVTEQREVIHGAKTVPKLSTSARHPACGWCGGRMRRHAQAPTIDSEFIEITGIKRVYFALLRPATEQDERTISTK